MNGQLFKNFQKKFFCTECAGYSNCVSVFALTGRLLSLHQLSGAHELPQAGSPLTGGSFSAPESRGARTALACSPLMGGSFSAPTQRGTRTAAGVFALTGRLLFLHRKAGVRELR